MKKQNYENHSTINYLNKIQIFHFICMAVLMIVSAGNLAYAVYNANGRLNASTCLLISILYFSGYFVFRGFSLRAQDRAIRAEENLRHFVLTGKLLDKNLKISQIIALRFAEDQEFITLAQRALDEKLNRKEIKLAIQNWKEDTHRA